MAQVSQDVLAIREHLPLLLLAWLLHQQPHDLGLLVKRKCFCCERDIACHHDGSFGDSLVDATSWRTGGNYGSSVFDPMVDESLEIYVCDDCLVKKSSLAYFFKTTHCEKHTGVRRFDLQRKSEQKKAAEACSTEKGRKNFEFRKKLINMIKSTRKRRR